MSEPVMLMEDLHEEEELSPDKAHSLREIFDAKLMMLGSAGKLIRWVTGLGIAQILVAVLLIGMNMLDLPRMSIGGEQSISLPVLIGCITFMALAWTWLLAGALHSVLWLRILIFVLFYATQIVLFMGRSSSVTAWMLLLLGLLYAVWHGITRPKGYVRDMLVLGLGIAFLYMSSIDQFQLMSPTGNFAAVIISLQVSGLSLLMLPLFMFAGLDLGESMRDVTRWLIGQGAARMGDGMLLAVAVTLSIVKAVLLVWWSGPGLDWIPAVLFLLAVGVVAVRLRPWEGLHHEPQAWLLLAGIGVLYVLMFLFALAGSPDTANWWATSLGGLLSAGVVALLVTRPRRGPGIRTAATFLSILALWLLFWSGTSQVIWGEGAGLAMHIDSIDAAAAVLLPVLLLVLAARRLISKSIGAWAIALTLGLSAIRGMAWLVENNWSIPATVAAGQLVIMAVGLLWDVITSGDRWTNGHSEKMPRAARVLLYFGYVAMSVTAILFWKGVGSESSFDDDSLALIGLLLVGVPLYLYGFARAGVLLVRQAAERRRTAA